MANYQTRDIEDASELELLPDYSYIRAFGSEHEQWIYAYMVGGVPLVGSVPGPLRWQGGLFEWAGRVEILWSPDLETEPDPETRREQLSRDFDMNMWQVENLSNMVQDQRDQLEAAERRRKLTVKMLQKMIRQGMTVSDGQLGQLLTVLEGR